MAVSIIKFEVDEIVEVVHYGLTYDSYRNFGKRHGHPDAVFNLPTNGDIGIILAHGAHEDGYDYLYIIYNLRTGKKSIIGQDGIERLPHEKIKFIERT